MKNSKFTFVSLDRGRNQFYTADWSGTPNAETGIFTIGGGYAIRFLKLCIAVWPEGVMGDEKPILSMQYHASLVSGDAWPPGNDLSGMVPCGKWYFDGRDDLGTEYGYQQGASGFLDPAGRTIFDSDISFEPDVPVNARWVEIRFMDGRKPGEPVHTFRADVPPLKEFLVP